MSEERERDTGRGGPEGRYANYFQVGHNAFEFVLEFGQLYREGETPALHTRIIANPAYASVFLRVLADALEEYRRVFGEVPQPDSPPRGGADSDRL